MENQLKKNENLITIFVSILSLLLFGLFLFTSKSILSPILLYVLILIFYLLNKKEEVVKNVFLLSTIIFLTWFFYEILSILTPFLIAFIFAYLLNPFVLFLERKKLPRLLGTTISIFAILLIGGLILSFIIPPFFEQIGLLISSAPQKISELNEFFNRQVLPELNRLGVIYPEFQKFISTELPSKLNNLFNGIFNNILSVISGVSVVFNQIVNLIIIPVMTFYFLKDFDKILKAFLKLFNSDFQNKLLDISSRIDKIFGNYIRSFLMVSLINGTIVTTGLTLIGVPYAVVLGLLSALLNFIPYFGVIISFSIGFLISILSGVSGLNLILVPVVYFGENLLESSLIVPKIIGEKVGLHPLLILFAIFVFGYFGGIVGMLISVPVTALLVSIVVDKKD